MTNIDLLANPFIMNDLNNVVESQTSSEDRYMYVLTRNIHWAVRQVNDSVGCTLSESHVPHNALRCLFLLAVTDNDIMVISGLFIVSVDR